jgi:membrane-associated phospholipid phosphatase
MAIKKIIHTLLPLDVATLAYILITGTYIILGASKLQNIAPHLVTRGIFIAIIGLVVFLDTRFQHTLLRFYRHFYPLSFLGYFYAETAYLNHIVFHSFDPWVVNLEQTIFGCQPSVLFSKYFYWKWFNELMCFGYVSYFVLIFGVCFWIYKFANKKFQFSFFVICASFYLCYLFFILFPVEGPQFYFAAPDNQLPNAYFFRHVLELVREAGEKPTAAFPSSHVAITCLLLFLSAKNAPKLFYWIIPSALLLFLSAVYIKAHYVIDVIAGFFTFPILYWISSRIYSRAVRFRETRIRESGLDD